MVSRRPAERLLQLRRPARRGGCRGPRRLPLGRRARRRPANDHVRRSPAGRRAVRERATAHGRAQGHARRHLHGHGPRAADRHAGVCAARGPAHGRLRRVLGRGPLRSHERHGVRGPDHAGRGLARRSQRAPQAERRSGPRAKPRGSPGRRASTHRWRDRHARRARPLVARAHRGRVGRPGVLPLRADGCRGSALPAVHLGHDREAEGHRPHDRRLPRRRGDHAPLHLRREARLGVLVRRRCRLGHRPQLHRVRPALQRHDRGDLRGRSELPERGALVGDHRALPRRHPVHRADRDPRPHEVGTRACGPPRPVVAAPARLGRRADQPRGVDVVPRARGPGPHAGRRHVVADRDRDDHDHPAPGRDDAQARLGHEAVPDDRRRGVRRGGP